MRADAFIACNRFGLGYAAEDAASLSGDARAWLKAQLARPAALPAELAALPPSSEGLREFPRWLARLRTRRQERAMQDGQPRGVEESFRDHFGPLVLKEVGARMSVAAATRAPFRERLVWFWANHFTVSAQKPAVVAVTGSFEREAIRPHLDGRFAELLLAATKHPAMIVYLDNHLSGRPRGLNENLAREILELHTVGVSGGYTQADVTSFARALTGWALAGEPSPGFFFRPGRHERGAKTVLGREYAEEGVAQGEAVLRDLAAHPATVRHIATKLARHFIADDPPPAAIERIARAWRDSGGHLPAVHAALVDCPEAWQAPLAKLKSPSEYVASCLRALPVARHAPPQALFFALNQMGQRPFSAPSPQGWPDTAAAWAGADALWKRIEFAGILASRAGSGIDPLALAQASYGEALSAATRTAIARAESREQGLALWLASPEFQRR
jgi:uncharacterized protein (DUF1800 family)